MNTESIIFKNKSGLPITICTWIKKSEGLSETKDVYVKDTEEVKLISSTGEWYLETMFEDRKDIDLWESHGYKILEIGKFRSKPCASNNYSWMYHDDFKAIYDDGTITFVCNKINLT